MVRGSGDDSHKNGHVQSQLKFSEHAQLRGYALCTNDSEHDQ